MKSVMASFTAGLSSFGLGNLLYDPAAVKREVATLLGDPTSNLAPDPAQDSVSLSQKVTGVNEVNIRIGISSQSASNSGVAFGEYTLQFDKSSSSITLTDKISGETTTITGDPHVTENNQTFTFKNDTTFQLGDGTTMTIKTVPAGNGQTLSDEVDLSKGALSMTVSGLASSDSNPLTISGGFDGSQMRAANASDPTIYQRDGQWTSQDGTAVDQTYANQNL